VHFEQVLDAVLGERQIFHKVDCPVCGFEEIFYESQKTNRLIGRACSHCNFIHRFEKINGHTRKESLMRRKLMND
jgi:hypothetical protein